MPRVHVFFYSVVYRLQALGLASVLGCMPCDALEPTDRAACWQVSPPLSPHSRARFSGIGDLPGGAYASAAFAVTGDGAHVVGYATEAGQRAVRWSPGLGLQALSAVESQAFAVSSDGRVIAGREETTAARWTTGAAELAPIPAVLRTTSQAYGVSADGRVVVGNLTQIGAPPGTGFTWTSSAPNVTFYSASSVLTGTNQDGSVVVGMRLPTRYGGPHQATRNETLLPFAFLPDCSSGTCAPPPCLSIPSCSSEARAISADGSVVAGWAKGPASQVPMIWSVSNSEIEGSILSTAPGAALAVSGDGQVVGGYTENAGQRTATLWTEGRTVPVVDELARARVPLNGWSLTQVRGLSHDGSVIAGEGINPQGQPEGWVALLPH
jgi:uncharacterized membrane protein